ncbi:MAG: SRPBCC domain-containing protein [Candidatus Eisenbacteria bacterium]|nr:SRPBCC domain-containing protein [Candidatus Eisenbacteria bacterium]
MPDKLSPRGTPADPNARGADGAAHAPERVINGEVMVDAPLSEVWNAWTTEEGIKSFFAPACNIELRVGGAYEMFFLPDGEPGKRGGEGCRIMAIQPERMLSFTWNAPPHLPKARAQFTHVTIRFEPVGSGGTRVELRHDGWGDGGQWDEAFAYFQRAWIEIVLPNLVRRFGAQRSQQERP